MASLLENLHGLGFVTRRPRLFSIELENYTLDLLMRPSKRLVVTFEFAGTADNKPDRQRPGWGFKFFDTHRDFSVAFVKPATTNWYRPPGLYELCDQLNDIGLFDRFDTVMTYGGSMGGYGAIAYADAFRADRVLSMNPQATLAADIVPWEKRFPKGSAQDWSTAPVVAGAGCRKADQVVVVYDRLCREDAIHADLLDVPGKIDLNLPFVGHGIPVHLRKMGVLEDLFFALAEDRFDIRDWRRKMRKRRDLEDYRTEIDRRLAARAAR